MTMPFAKFESKAWPYRFKATLLVDRIVGGVPSDPGVAQKWLESKIVDNDDLIRKLVAETMVERGIGADEAVKEVDRLKHLNGFKRDDQGLYIEGRQVKAAIKEAGNIAGCSGKLPTGKKAWGVTGKGLMGFFAEHIFVEDDRIHLGVSEPAGIQQRFVFASGPTGRRTGIQYEEYVDEAKISFHVITDNKFTDEQWAMIWLTGQQQGLGATRSQGYGRYTVIEWGPDPL